VPSTSRLIRRTTALAAWCYLVWLLLTLTPTVEVLLVGVPISVLCAALLAPLAPAAGPWRLLRPVTAARWLRGSVRLGASIVRANVAMARLVWSSSVRPPSGMVVVPSRTDDSDLLATVGLLSSLVVDNQVVDVDPSRSQLLYHCVRVPPEDADAYERVNGPVEHVVTGQVGDPEPQR
jgi:multicomponent Na+:H+ antiporter subunit E